MDIPSSRHFRKGSHSGRRKRLKSEVGKDDKRKVCNIATDSGKTVGSSSKKYSSYPQDEESDFVLLAKGFRDIVLRDLLKVDQEKYKLLLQEEVKKMMGL